MERRPPSSGLTRRFTGLGIAMVLFSAGIVASGFLVGATVGIAISLLGAIGIAMGLFVAVTAAFRIGPGRQIADR